MVPFQKGKEDAIESQKEMELQLEVEELERTLEYEEKVRQILKGAMVGRLPIPIPRFLHPKVQELLEEFAAVEGDIGRLEERISRMQWELTKSQAFRSSHHQNQASSLPLPFPTTTAYPQRHEKLEEKLALKAMPMFFIDQAIRGHYGFAIGKKDFAGLAMKSADRKARRRGIQGGGDLKRSLEGTSSFSKLTPNSHHPASTIVLDWDNNASPNFQKLETSSNTLSSDKHYPRKFQANELSEGIMKCLICIFLRLMRKRATKQEKSSISPRSNGRILTPRSFTDNGNATLRQKDPYGIFDAEDSLPRDIGPYKNLVICTSSMLDPKGMSTCVPLLKRLRALLNMLEGTNLISMKHNQKLAFWINIHNAIIMHGFLEQGFPMDPDDMLALRSKSMINIGGTKLNAATIEHAILRQTHIVYEDDKADNKDQNIHSLHGLEKPDSRIIFALCCGNKSSPAVRIYTAEGISTELEKAKQEYIQASIVVTSAKKIKIPLLLVMNMKETVQDLELLPRWICNHLPVSDSLRKSMITCISRQKSNSASNMVEILPYIADFQCLLPM